MVENSQSAVEAFAAANGIEFSVGKTLDKATRALFHGADNPFAAFMEGQYLLKAYDDIHPNNPFIGATGTSTAIDGRRVAVYAPQGWNDSAYAVSMHEIGHIMTWAEDTRDSVHGVGSTARVDDETRAWEWAVANVAEWTPDMQRYRDYALNNYSKAVTRG